MSKYIVLVGNTVENIVIADETEAAKHGWMPYPSEPRVSIGWTYENGVWSEPPPNIEAIKAAFIQASEILLADSNSLVAPDLWESYTQTERDNVSQYRRELREVPNVVESEDFDYETYTLPIRSVN